MPKCYKIVLLVLAVVLLASCGGPKPPATSRPKAMATSPWVDVLPVDGWFSIRAAGRVAAFQSELVVVYQDGRVAYTDQSDGQQAQGKLDENGIARWKRMFVNQAKFMSLQDNYPPGEPQPVDPEEKDSPKFNDAIRYTILYREGGVVKTINTNKSGAPRELVPILNEFWNLVDELKGGGSKE